MRRRTYIGISASALTASICGCITSPTSTQPATTMETEFTVCGRASSQSCEAAGIDTALEEQNGTYRENADTGEAVSVSPLRNGTVTVVGRTNGIGDPKCRDTVLERATIDGSTLKVDVGNENNPPLIGGCYETREENYYSLTVSGIEPMLSTIRVRHYNQQTLQFEETIDLSET